VLKQFYKSRLLPGLIAWLAALYIRFVLKTSRMEIIGREILERYWASGQPFIVAFWHGQMLLMVYPWQTTRIMHMLISHNTDGEIIARAVSNFGIRAVRGSSDKNRKDKGGRAAIRTMLKIVKGGDCLGFTPDGPRGPRLRAKEGIAVVARLSGAPIVPVVAATSRRMIISGSWDGFVINLPFSRGVIYLGTPIHVARDADATAIEAARLSLETALNDLTAQACARVGCDPVPAATK